MEPIEKNINGGFGPEILVSNVRVLRPSEAKALIDAVPKDDQKLKLEALLYTGMRYIEVHRLWENPNWFKKDNIHLTKEAIKKKKIKIKERYVHLNTIGKRVVQAFLKVDNNLPDYKTWTENLQRWAELAGISPKRLGPKSMRKTWECWLVHYYPTMTPQIFLSQGHDTLTALHHYVNLPFNKEDKESMGEFVGGWE